MEENNRSPDDEENISISPESNDVRSTTLIDGRVPPQDHNLPPASAADDDKEEEEEAFLFRGDCISHRCQKENILFRQNALPQNQSVGGHCFEPDDLRCISREIY